MINEGLSRIVPSEASFSDGNKGSSTHALQNDDQHTKERKMLEVKIGMYHRTKTLLFTFICFTFFLCSCETFL